MYVCTYVRMYVCTYVRMYVCMYVCMYDACTHNVKTDRSGTYDGTTSTPSAPMFLQVRELPEALRGRARSPF